MALHLQKGVGPKTVRRIYETFGSFAEAFRQRKRLEEVIGPSRAAAVLSADPDRAEREMRRAEALGVRIVSFLSDEYPERLRAHENMPVVLYVRGDLESLGGKTVAVVGTRYPSEDARTVSFELGKRLGKAGVTVVSGGAYGIDTQAHRGTMAGGGRTVVVLGSGMDRPYPRENVPLFREVVEKGGAVITEFPFGTPPNQGNFPARNRVISALSDVVVVVQAPERSGALITASWALEQGKDVWAVPFSPLDRRSYGSNRLIYDGARPIYDLSHFLEEVVGGPATMEVSRRPEVDEMEAFILALLKEPLHIDEITYKSGVPPHRLYAVLLSLQMKGYVRELPGKLYEAVL